MDTFSLQFVSFDYTYISSTAFGYFYTDRLYFIFQLPWLFITDYPSHWIVFSDSDSNYFSDQGQKALKLPILKNGCLFFNFPKFLQTQTFDICFFMHSFFATDLSLHLFATVSSLSKLGMVSKKKIIFHQKNISVIMHPYGRSHPLHVLNRDNQNLKG